ncbi:hypothetical protein PLANTIT3_20045 [Plantibacter sp. T3]|nr:hypothetical protein PLANTIT3_20045 [Plantibacter sp. T3]
MDLATLPGSKMEASEIALEGSSSI